MFAFTDEERLCLLEQHAIAPDAQGREVLVGLTFEETVSYAALLRKRRDTGRFDPGEQERYIELDNKHESARLAVVGAEAEKRTEDPHVR